MSQQATPGSRAGHGSSAAVQEQRRIADPALQGSSLRGNLAALDLGTNNCRLLIARPEGEGFVIVDAFSRIVRLGEGLAATGRLSDAAIERTLSALSVCARQAAPSPRRAGAFGGDRSLPPGRERRRIRRAGL